LIIKQFIEVTKQNRWWKMAVSAFIFLHFFNFFYDFFFFLIEMHNLTTK